MNLDIESIKTKIPSFSSEKLCNMIVCHRYLSVSSEISLFCMEELAHRRINGDSYPFEEIINSNFNKLPKLNTNMDLSTILGTLNDSLKK